jgi:hypothetical protein
MVLHICKFSVFCHGIRSIGSLLSCLRSKSIRFSSSSVPSLRRLDPCSTLSIYFSPTLYNKHLLLWAMLLSGSVLLAFSLPALVRGTPYSLIQDYSGSTFFDGWTFFGNGESRYITRFNPPRPCSSDGCMSQLTTSPTETRSTCAFRDAVSPFSDHRRITVTFFSPCSLFFHLAVS